MLATDRYQTCLIWNPGLCDKIVAGRTKSSKRDNELISGGRVFPIP